MAAPRPKLAVFRLDASPEVGAGHAMRCLALAEAQSAMGETDAAATALSSRSQELQETVRNVLEELRAA